MKSRLLALAFAVAAFAPSASADDAVLYQYRAGMIRDGASGAVAQLQAAMNPALAACGIDKVLQPDGAFGPGTRSAITQLSECEAVSARLEPDSPARSGAITAELWQALLPDTPVPDVDTRAAALKLTFEATDYDRMEWNYCQSSPRYNPEGGQPVCYSNDRASYITWGPNGATAGHGREVQAILNAFLAAKPETSGAELDAAFGSEAPAVRRMLELNGANANSPLEIYLCGVWMDPARRAAWKAGFKTFGKIPAVEEIYRDVYQSQSFDGGKIATFYKVWTSPEFALPVTEIDHAFFVDRSAQMSISAPALTSALRTLKAERGEAWPPSPADVRRHIALNVRASNKAVIADRLGRDLAFYAAQIGADALTEEERSAEKRGKPNADDLGLSDARVMPAFSPTPTLPHPMPAGTVTPDEAAMCPVAVLAPQLPPKK